MSTKTISTKLRNLHRYKGYWPLGLIALVIVASLALFLVTRFQTTSSEATGETLTSEDLLQGLLRSGVRPEGVFPAVDVLLAAPAYFSVTGRNPSSESMQEPSLLFYVTEDSHEEIPVAAPEPLLRIDGIEVGRPVQVSVLADSYHHRTTLIRYPAVNDQGIPLVTSDTRLLEIIFSAPGIPEASTNVLPWELPIIYAEGFSSSEVVLGIPAEVESEASTFFDSGSSLTWAAMLAIMAGMLTVLSPCLIQLVVYFPATLAAVSTEGSLSERSDSAVAQRHIMQTGIFFALGFTLVYTAGGAAAGFMGQSLDRLGLLNTWMRPLSVAAGVVIIVMAVRVAWNARAPLICRLPMTPLFGEGRRTGIVASALMGISFAGGCMACFSATVLPALLLYAGSTGSVTYGALLLLVFSLGISLPCLALAFGISKTQPLLHWFQKSGPLLGLASAAVMVGFGIIMITDQFHLVSGFIYQALETFQTASYLYIII